MSILASEDKAEAAAGIIRDTITSYMVLGVISKRDIFLRNIKQTQGLQDIRILRGDPVIRQFGPPREMERANKDIEISVLRTGQKKVLLNETMDSVEYTLIIPYKANRIGKINCLRCHNVKENDVLGAVSITMDLTDERTLWFRTLIFMSFASLVFFIGILIMIVFFFKPYTDMFSSLKNAFKSMEEGDFTKKVYVQFQDEAGAVAYGLNQTMNRLSYTLSGIRVKVAHLIGHPVFSTGNALRDTSDMVDELVRIYNFKRTIEKDMSVNEVYGRIAQIIQDMGLQYYTIYEANQESKKFVPVSLSSRVKKNGNKTDVIDPDQDENPIQWCKPVISDNVQECRARRTGSDVNSEGFPNVCPNFIEPGKGEEKYLHYCIPFYIAGQVHGVIQIVHTANQAPYVSSRIHVIKSYLQEAAPVIEARTYMELLKDQTIKDQLTGLYNRRFLDEYVASVVSRARRSDKTVGILMLDLDHFKQVNDDYGHKIGDKILKGVSRIITGAVRSADMVIRYGGEEILVILMDASVGNALEVAEKIRSKVENTTIVTPPHRLLRTISIGVSEFPTDSENFNECLQYADIALYQAKENGRNQVVRYKTKDFIPLN